MVTLRFLSVCNCKLRYDICALGSEEEEEEAPGEAPLAVLEGGEKGRARGEELVVSVAF